MNSRPRFGDVGSNEALDRALGALPQPYAFVGPLLEVAFPLANTRRDVRHRLGVIPTGYLVVLEQGGHIRAYDTVNWTTELAFLESDTANARVRLRFVVTLEAPVDA